MGIPLHIIDFFCDYIRPLVSTDEIFDTNLENFVLFLKFMSSSGKFHILCRISYFVPGVYVYISLLKEKHV